MVHCPDCGKEIEEGKPCPDCKKSKAGNRDAISTAGSYTKGSFSKNFLKDPIGSVRDAWENHRIRFAWLAMAWIYGAIALTRLIEQIISMIKFARPAIPALVSIVLHTIFDPLTTIAAFVVGAYAIVVIARRDKVAVPVTLKDALSGYGAAAIPYAIALTVAIPIYAAIDAFGGTVSQFFWLYPNAVIDPLWLGVSLLIFIVYREISGKTEPRHLLFGVLTLLAVQALASWFVGFVFGILLP